ncbi:MAG: rhodanese-like domain-containing protein [Bacilli bacterium]|nr:rhodanese-like domain-containing protein [Bacilli bacterium]
MKKLLIITLCVFLLSGCGETKNTDSSDGSVNYMEAKEKIINDGAILLDVRTKEEYNEKHIDGASLLPLDKIDIDSISQIVSEKDTPIIVYCRSGNRSQQAREKLIALGYSKVYDLGAMSNWKE